MNCQEFLERYSEYRDAVGDDPIRDPFLRHQDACPRCARYASVVEQGVAFLRDMPGPEPREDFRHRLRHRIYQAELEEARGRRGSGGSGWVTMALAAAAILTGMAVWGPIPLPTPTVSLPAVQARTPVPTSLPLLVEDGMRSGRTPGFLLQEDLWAQSHVLLYESSPLYQRTRGVLVRTGFQ